jgi:hypothetical protein
MMLHRKKKSKFLFVISDITRLSIAHKPQSGSDLN